MKEQTVRLEELKMGDKFYLSREEEAKLGLNPQFGEKRRIFLLLLKISRVGRIRVLDNPEEMTISLDTRVVAVNQSTNRGPKTNEPIQLNSLAPGAEFRFLERFFGSSEDRFLLLVKYTPAEFLVRHCRSGLQFRVSSERLVIQGSEEEAKIWQRKYIPTKKTCLSKFSLGSRLGNQIS